MATRDKSSWLPNLIGPVKLQDDGVDLTPRGTVNFVGFTVTDDPDNDTVEIEDTGGGGGSTPTGTGFTHITAGVQDAAAKLVVNADVDAAAAIAASKVVQATGTGFPHVTAGTLDAASVKVDVTNSAHVTVPATADGVVTSSGSVLQQPTNVKAGANYVSVGPTPAQAGFLRLDASSTGFQLVIAQRTGGADYGLLRNRGDASQVLWGNASFYQQVDGDGIVLNTNGGTTVSSFVGGVQLLTTAANGTQFGAGGQDFGGGTGVLGIDNASVVPSTNPTAGGILYSEGGAGKWRGSSGTVTTFGPAEPHCPKCGRDFAVEHRNDTHGEHLAICLPCLVDALQTAGVDTASFTITDKRAASKRDWDASHAAAMAAEENKKREIEASGG
jgi:hypothetical protein